MHVRAPFTSVAWEMIGTFLRTKKAVEDIKSQEHNEVFRYETDDAPTKNTPS